MVLNAKLRISERLRNGISSAGWIVFIKMAILSPRPASGALNSSFSAVVIRVDLNVLRQLEIHFHVKNVV